jgi:fumarate reductase flavoprotein subunit
MTDAGFEFTVPVLVVGGGACGCVAALAARDAGAEVLLIEQDARPMGSTGMSQGLFCAAGTKAQAAAGVDDDGETFYADIMAKSRGLADPVMARAIAFGSGPTADWLIDKHDLPWTLDRGFRPAYGNSRFRVHGWHGHGGIDMVPLLHDRIAAAGVDVLLQARLVEVIADNDGRVCGVAIARPDGAIERIGCDTLIFASGGFAANTAMVAAHMPEVAAARNNGHEGSQGIAVKLGPGLGAAVGDMGSYQGYAMLTEPQGISVPPGIIVEGGLIVNVLGERFTDESADIAGMVLPVLAQPGGHCWVIFDAGIEQRCGYIPETQALIALNAARVADSVEELAGQIGVPAGVLAATLADAYDAQRAGLADGQGRVWGNDCPPVPAFRALKVVGAIYHTQGGLQIDGEARVLREDGSVLPNVFAGGGAARSVSGPAHWGYLPAMGLCTAVTLGRIAGQTAARQALDQR